ncbi:MAG: hypothetical protein JKY93_07365 [Gammaproteobacteria bacterium]|nr:hypothetical protein [Gammaproteobacteria bacterium]
MFPKKLRVFLLLLILLFVALNSWSIKSRSTDWDQPLWVAIYPINADGSNASKNTIQTLSVEDFQFVESFMRREAKRYALSIENPVTMKLAPEIKELPPTPPIDGNTLGIIVWSLKMRYWAYSRDTFVGPSPDIQIFVLYHDPKQTTRLAHSLGLQKGLIGVVNAFAGREYRGSNNMVIAHEMLHTVGASDKYDGHNNQPIYPEGFARPDQTPLYPQHKAEIMAGRVPLSATESIMPTNLKRVVVGEQTSKEINWTN